MATDVELDMYAFRLSMFASGCGRFGVTGIQKVSGKRAECNGWGEFLGIRGGGEN